MTLLKYLSTGLIAVALCLGASPAMAEVVAVVSTRSTVTALSQNQLVDIFLGKLNRLPNGQLAVPIDQAEGAPAREAFYQRYAGKSAAQVKAHWAKIIFTGRGQPPATAANADEVKRRVTANPNAIGYIDREAVDETIRIISLH